MLLCKSGLYLGIEVSPPRTEPGRTSGLRSATSFCERGIFPRLLVVGPRCAREMLLCTSGSYPAIEVSLPRTEPGRTSGLYPAMKAMLPQTEPGRTSGLYPAMKAMLPRTESGRTSGLYPAIEVSLPRTEPGRTSGLNSATSFCWRGILPRVRAGYIPR
ncbi:hypothetical protein MAQ5080_02023 [Marinomonas aquimarina]|uniref:Uncharacterized protein n=1 Tax=Marinomonas aquimarina TaxID=295068 RepID=A0A1A8TF46_9GAMM|nr:hypothetical protein MAQ5080_02023 [Marinomonas aquimarina]